MSVLRATRVLLGDDRCGRSQPTCKINLDNASAHNLRWVGFAGCCVTLEDLSVKRGDLEEDIFAIVARHVLGSDHDVLNAVRPGERERVFHPQLVRWQHAAVEDPDRGRMRGCVSGRHVPALACGVCDVVRGGVTDTLSCLGRVLAKGLDVGDSNEEAEAERVVQQLALGKAALKVGDTVWVYTRRVGGCRVWSVKAQMEPRLP